MDLKKLEYLESIYRLCSFTKAAEEQYVSQPSISNAIQSLEEELDVILINRNTRPLSFTKAGEEFMEHVYQILKAVENAQNAMKLHSRLNHETLNMAIYSASMSQIIPKICMDFHNLFPQCTLHVTECTHATMLQRIQTGELDMAYTLLPEEYDKNIFQMIPLETCNLHVILSNQHPMANEPELSLDQLQAERIYTYPRGSLIRQKLEQLQISENISLNLTVPNRFDFVKFFVAENQGITFAIKDKFHNLPSYTGLVSKPLKKPLCFQTGLIFKQGGRMTTSMKNMKHYLEHIY